MSNHNNRVIRTVTVLWNGLELAVPVTYFERARAMPIASTPDCPGFDDEGDPGEVVYDTPVLVSVDCAETFMEFLNLPENDDFGDLVFAGLSR